jgi:hypothetical protein
MLKRLKIFITSLMVSGFIFLPLGCVSVAHASNINQLCAGASFDVSNVSGAQCPGGSGTKVNNIIKFALNLFSVIVGLISVVMIIMGGLKYVLSGGDSNKVSGAKDTILFAIVGLVIVAIAQVIVHFVITSVQKNS